MSTSSRYRRRKMLIRSSGVEPGNLLRRQSPRCRSRDSTGAVPGIGMIHVRRFAVALCHARPRSAGIAGLVTPEDIKSLSVGHFLGRDVEIGAYRVVQNVVFLGAVARVIGEFVLLVQKVAVDVVLNPGVESLRIGGNSLPVDVVFVPDLPDGLAGA